MKRFTRSRVRNSVSFEQYKVVIVREDNITCVCETKLFLHEHYTLISELKEGIIFESESRYRFTALRKLKRKTSGWLETWDYTFFHRHVITRFQILKDA